MSPPLTTRHLVVAGWLAMVSALLTVPWLILGSLAPHGGAMVPVAQSTILILGATIYTFFMVSLRKLLHQKHASPRADLCITSLITVNSLSALVGIMGFVLPTLATSLDDLGLMLVVAMGVLQILLGVRLLSLPDRFHGLHRPFCWLTCGTGLCFTVIILLPLGMVLSAVSDIMLGTIFFQVAAEQEGQQPAPEGEEWR